MVTTLVCYLHFAHEAAGAAGTRHSPRPLIFLGEKFMHNSGVSRRGIAGVYLELAEWDDLGSIECHYALGVKTAC